MGHESRLALTILTGPVPIAICIPARNEAASLPALCAALDRLDRQGVDLTICLLLDTCHDASVEVAGAYATRAPSPVVVEQLVQPDPNAGRARNAAMLLGVAALDGPGLLLSTDADSVPDADWLQAMVAGCRAADVVAGRVVRTVTQPNPLQDRIEAYYDMLHALRRTIDPVAWEAKATHHHASGANLGLSADSYRALGGFLPLANGEDARLIDDAGRAGLRVRRDAASVVNTSDRRIGRVAHGFAGSLRALDRGDEAVDVAHPRDMIWQYRRHADARAAFEAAHFADLATAIGLSQDHVLGVARDCANAEAFAMCVVPTPPAGMRRVALAVAEAEVSALCATLPVGRRAA